MAGKTETGNRAVSYTHLDVYKRQMLYGAESWTLRKADASKITAVSKNG